MIFIDCSGDGDLAAQAGAALQTGKHAAGHNDMRSPSTMFRLHGVDPVRVRDTRVYFAVWMEKAEQLGRKAPRKSPIFRPEKILLRNAQT